MPADGKSGQEKGGPLARNDSGGRRAGPALGWGMEIVAIALGVLAAGLAGAVVWLMVERGREAAGRGAMEAELAGAKREREEAAARLAAREGELRGVTEEAGRLRVECAQVAEQLAGARRDREEDLGHARRLHEREIEAVREGFAQEMEKERTVNAERLAAVERAREEIQKRLGEFEVRVEKTFEALAGKALKGNSEQFLTLAEQKLAAKAGVVDELVKPIAETLKKTGEKLAVIEQAGKELQSETGRLVRALRDPHVRGRYGEMQLKRVAELAGMSAYCDFEEQGQVRDGDGVAKRPDMVVKMPNSRVIVVDAKTNIRGYLDALEARTSEESEGHLERFARHVAEQATALAKKKYWSDYSGSPEFVVMFIPGDQFIDAALARQPELLERAAEQGVILASPSTLIGLLRAVAVGYREQALATAAEELRELGKEFHERVAKAMEHFAGLGKSLEQAVNRYNDFAASYASRLEPTMRKFEESGVKSGKELPGVVEIGGRVRGAGGVNAGNSTGLGAGERAGGAQLRLGEDEGR